MHDTYSRREWLKGTSTVVGTGWGAHVLGSTAAAEEAPAKNPFRFCLNTSTIRGQGLSLVEEVEIAAKAGYQGLEPWVGELEKCAAGGSLADVGKRIRDRGLQVESAIGFFEWIVDDPARRAKGLETARRAMDLVKQVGGSHIAAPPVGATNQTDLNLLRAGERYRDLLEVGSKIGVVPQVELWGFSKTLGRLGETALVAVESGHPQACILADVYHLYKGGSNFAGIRLLNGAAMHAFHMNDYPAAPPRADIADAQRVYPGDGVAPLAELLGDLWQCGFRGALSLELFNRDYWKQDALTVARTGLQKMQAAVAKGLARKP